MFVEGKGFEEIHVGTLSESERRVHPEAVSVLELRRWKLV